MNLFIKKSHITLRSSPVALCFDPSTLIEIAVYLYLNMVKHEASFFKVRTQMCFGNCGQLVICCSKRGVSLYSWFSHDNTTQILEFKTGRPTKFLPSFKERLPKNMSFHNFLAGYHTSF